MIVVVFRARLLDDRREEYYRRAAQMAEIARSMPGFISYKGYRGDDGERVSIHEWESAESLRAWREHPEHKRMQRYGRDNFYDEYTLYVCERPRESRFRREPVS